MSSAISRRVRLRRSASVPPMRLRPRPSSGKKPTDMKRRDRSSDVVFGDKIHSRISGQYDSSAFLKAGTTSARKFALFELSSNHGIHPLFTPLLCFFINSSFSKTIPYRYSDTNAVICLTIHSGPRRSLSWSRLSSSSVSLSTWSSVISCTFRP